MKNILFDLDGTLTDPKEGITKSIAYAMEKLERKAPPVEDLLWCIGPPLHRSFEKLLGSRQLVDEAVLHYRERYAVMGMFENKPYDGIYEVLEELKKTYTLYVATSKYRVSAEKIIDQFKFRQYFKKVYGSEADGERGDKGELLSYLLKEENLAPRNCVMVGDTKYDILGAVKNKIKAFGVAWGYGIPSELIQAGAEKLVSKPSELLHIKFF